MVTTRSSPRKKPPKPAEPALDQDLEDGEDVAPEDVKVAIAEDEVAGKTLEPADTNPPKLVILPRDASSEARIVTLSEPSTGAHNRYFVCPDRGVYEFTKITATRAEARSVLLAPTRGGQHESHDANTESRNSITRGYISESADILVATPVDPVFLLIPILAPAPVKDQKRLFVTFEDHIDSTTGTLRQLLQREPVRKHFEARLDSICDRVDAGDEIMYRISIDKLAALLVSKARRMVQNGLPASMEEKFVRQALQAPILNIRREAAQASKSNTELDADSGDSQASSDTTMTASTSASTDTVFSQNSTSTSVTSIAISQDSTTDDFTETASNEASTEVKHLLRLRIALQYIQTCYVAAHIRALLDPVLNTLIDYAPLDAHVKRLESLHEEARALRSLSDNITRKRGHDDDEEAEERAEKRRRKEEEDKRKRQESNALKQLKKADTSGMKKLSSFFTRVPKKA